MRRCATRLLALSPSLSLSLSLSLGIRLRLRLSLSLSLRLSLIKPSRVPSSPSPAPCFKKGCSLGTCGSRLGCIWLQVREVFVKHRAAILGDDALGQHAQLAVMQVNLTLSQSPNLSLRLR